MSESKQQIYTISGKDKFFEYFNALAKELKQGDFYYAFAFQDEYQSVDIKNFLKKFHLDIAKKKIDDRAIFYEKMERIAGATYYSNSNIEIKYKKFNIPIGLVVTKNRIIQLGWQPEPFVVEIKNAALFKHYYDFFIENWNSNEAMEFTKEVLNKLDYQFSLKGLNRVNNLGDYKNAVLVTESIEKIENVWKYKITSKKKKFGQKVLGETIKLWSVPKTTAEFLEFMVVATKSKSILEIGTSAGYSSIYLAMGASYNKGVVKTIENLKSKIKLAKNNFKKSKLNNIKLIEGNALDVLRFGRIKNFDFIFLDADKENYGKYFDPFMPFLKKGGFIVADNVFDYGHMMKDYLDKVLGTKLPNSQSDKRVVSYTLPIDNGVIVTRKIED